MKERVAKCLGIIVLLAALGACGTSGGGGGAGAGNPQPLGSIGVAFPGNGDTTNDTTPLRWDAVTGAVNYEYQLTTVPNDVTTAPVSTVDGQSGFGYPVAAPLDNNVQYVWRMRAIGNGETTAWTAPATFTVSWGATGPLDNIRFAEELASLPDLGGNYRLGGDIDLSGVASWTPIGTQATQFTGDFDGAGHTITGLSITGTNDDQGLFGRVGSGANITNIALRDAAVVGGRNVGALVGRIDGGQISNASVIGTSTVTGGSDYGGLVGFVGIGAQVSDSYSSATVQTEGGAVGTATNAGGLVGRVSGGTVSGSYATGSVTHNGIGAGGLVGFLTGGLGGGTLSDSYATGAVAGQDRVGGLVGNFSGGTAAITNGYAIGVVSTVSIAGPNIGGLVGSLGGGATLTDGFYDSTTTTQSDTGKGEPRITAQMRDVTTFTTGGPAWDFTTVWAIAPGTNGGYPYLRAIPPQ